MEGLIQDAMPQQAAAAKQMPMGMEPVDGMQQESAGEEDPKFQAALKFAMSAMYDGKGSDAIATVLTKSDDKVQALADTTYNILSVVEERTQGAVPDDLLALLAVNVLEEVADIGIAAGVELTGADVATALKQMILRFVGEQGYDTTELQQAMDQVDPAMFEQMAAQEA